MKLFGIKSGNISSVTFWIMIYLLSIFPLLLSRFDLDLYLLPQFEILITFFLSIYTAVVPLQYFVYGVFIDVSYGNPIGITPLLLISVNYVIKRYKLNLSKQDIMSLLLYFACTNLVVVLLKHLLFLLNGTKYYQYKEIIVNIVVTIICYPFLHFLLSRTSYVKNNEN